MTKDNRQNFESLVDELMKRSPNLTVVRQLTKKLGLEFSADLVTQMNIVLQASGQYTISPQKKQVKPTRLEK